MKENKFSNFVDVIFLKYSRKKRESECKHYNACNDRKTLTLLMARMTRMSSSLKINQCVFIFFQNDICLP